MTDKTERVVPIQADRDAAEPFRRSVGKGYDPKHEELVQGFAQYRHRLQARPEPVEAEEVRAALKWFVDHGQSLITDVSSAHSGRGAGASSFMREDDGEFRDGLRQTLKRAAALLERTLTPSVGEAKVRAEVVAEVRVRALARFLLWQYDRKRCLAESSEAWEELRAALIEEPTAESGEEGE